MTITFFMIQLLILIAGFGLGYYNSYFNQKGKNLATREDIKELTKSIEEIKNGFIKEVEQLKINLQFEKEVKISIHTETKQAAIQAYKDFNLWCDSVTNCSQMAGMLAQNELEEKNKQINTYHEIAINQFLTFICLLEKMH